jgi:glycosyltransferase involved in cell wall biosynthesis
MSTLPSYVVITPARNEAKFVELTIQSIIAQTVRPLKWVIVSDGSMDGTDEIVRRYAEKYSWIELVRMPERSERHFAGKVHAFNAGYKVVEDLQHEVIASLDADITFDADYFSYLLGKLASDPALGLIGTPFQEGANSIYDYRFVNIEHVSGACQVFRRACFSDIGGYVPVKTGCIDHIAVLSARMKGWKTRTFTDRICHHHRDMGTAQQNVLAARFKNGRKDYSIGNHPLWEFSRVLYQMSKRPFIFGGVMLACGYSWAMVRREPRPVTAEMKAFVRREQMDRLKRFFVNFPVFRKQQSAAKATSACS